MIPRPHRVLRAFFMKPRSSARDVGALAPGRHVDRLIHGLQCIKCHGFPNASRSPSSTRCCLSRSDLPAPQRRDGTKRNRGTIQGVDLDHCAGEVDELQRAACNVLCWTQHHAVEAKACRTAVACLNELSQLNNTGCRPCRCPTGQRRDGVRSSDQLRNQSTPSRVVHPYQRPHQRKAGN